MCVPRSLRQRLSLTTPPCPSLAYVSQSYRGARISAAALPCTPCTCAVTHSPMKEGERRANDEERSRAAVGGVDRDSVCTTSQQVYFCEAFSSSLKEIYMGCRHRQICTKADTNYFIQICADLVSSSLGRCSIHGRHSRHTVSLLKQFMKSLLMDFGSVRL